MCKGITHPKKIKTLSTAIFSTDVSTPEISRGFWDGLKSGKMAKAIISKMIWTK
jgi:hypothetical protein